MSRNRRFPSWAIWLLSLAVATAGVVLAAHSATSAGAAQAGVSSHSAADVDHWPNIFVFLLASFIGLGVIRRVSRLLHTPLMSLTNAISAIAVVGAIIVMGDKDSAIEIQVLGGIALFASVTNIVSGFLITDRMLKMFKQGDSK